jgi:hypothetical protein
MSGITELTETKFHLNLYRSADLAPFVSIELENDRQPIKIQWVAATFKGVTGLKYRPQRNPQSNMIWIR